MSRIAGLFHRATIGLGETPEPETQIPAERMARVQGVLRRRVSDAVEDAFQRACLAGDLTTARDLIGVLERMIERGESLREGERRRLPGLVRRLREELARCEMLQAGVEGTPS